MKKLIFILLAVLMVSCGSYQQALRKHNRLTDREKLTNSTVFIDASREKMLGNVVKSKKLYEYILSVDPLHDAALYEMSLLLAGDSKFEEAIEKIDLAIKVESDNKWYKVAKATIYQRSGQFVDAAKEYRKLISQYAFDENYYLSEAECYFSANQVNKALDVYDELQNIIGYSEELGLKKWYVLANLNKEDVAIKELEKLAKNFPANSQYSIALVDYYSQKGDLINANRFVDEILKNDPNNAQANAFKYMYLNYIGQRNTATNLLLNYMGNPGVGIDEKVNIFLSISDIPSDTAIMYSALDTLVKVNSDEAKAWSLSADFNYSNHRNAQAIEMWKKVIELDSSKFLVWEPLMLSLYSEKRFNELNVYSSRAVNLFPEQFTAWYFQGLAFYELKNYDKAINSFNTTLDLIFENKEIKLQTMSLLAGCYYYEKRYDESFAMYEKILLISPSDYFSLNNYAYYLALQNRELDKAEKNIIKALDLKPEMSSFWDTYAFILFKKQQYADAEKSLQKAFELGADKSATSIEHYGDVLFFLGKTNEAVEQWKKAKQIGTSSELIDKKIDDKKYYE